MIPEPQPDTPPVITAQLVRDVVADLIEIEANNGYHGIAVKHGVRESQVRTLDRMRMRRIAQLTEPEPEASKAAKAPESKSVEATKEVKAAPVAIKSTAAPAGRMTASTSIKRTAKPKAKSKASKKK